MGKPQRISHLRFDLFMIFSIISVLLKFAVMLRYMFDCAGQVIRNSMLFWFCLIVVLAMARRIQFCA
jgi:hypothetical protein